MKSIKDIRSRLDQAKGRKSQLETNLAKEAGKKHSAEQSLAYHESAREIVREVGVKTQEQLQFHISDITTLALSAVFSDPYELKVEFVQRRNKTECDLFFVRNDDKLDPLSASGGGAVDVASFALRIACWSMKIPHSRNLIVLDEPFRFVSENLQEKAAIMIKEVSEKLGVQFLIITHNQTLASYADKTFNVQIKDKVSRINLPERTK